MPAIRPPRHIARDPAVTIPAATAAGTHKLIAVDNADDRAAKTITVS